MTGLLFFNCFSASRIYSGKAKLHKCFQERVARLTDPCLFLAPKEVLQPAPCKLLTASVLSLKEMVSWTEMWSWVMKTKVCMRQRRPGSDLQGDPQQKAECLGEFTATSLSSAGLFFIIDWVSAKKPQQHKSSYIYTICCLYAVCCTAYFELWSRLCIVWYSSLWFVAVPS